MQTTPFLLLAILYICHYIADFQLTTSKMIEAKANGGKYLPIMQHAGIHALLMAVCLVLFGVKWQTTILLFLLQFVSHFLIDMGKGRINKFYPTTADVSQKIYWQLYGFDQLMHSFVIITMCYFAVY